MLLDVSIKLTLLHDQLVKQHSEGMAHRDGALVHAGLHVNLTGNDCDGKQAYHLPSFTSHKDLCIGLKNLGVTYRGDMYMIRTSLRPRLCLTQCPSRHSQERHPQPKEYIHATTGPHISNVNTVRHDYTSQADQARSEG